MRIYFRFSTILEESRCSRPDSSGDRPDSNGRFSFNRVSDRHDELRCQNNIKVS